MLTSLLQCTGRAPRALVAAAFWIAAGSAVAADGVSAPDRKPQPRMELPQPERQAGRMEPGPVLEILFPVRNAGDAPLEILTAQPDCGCVVASFDHEIAPGTTGAVKVALRTERLRGRLAKHVTLETNDPRQPFAVLTLNVEVVPPIEFDPGTELTIPVQRGLPVVREVQITCNQTEPLRVSKVETSAPFLRARVVGDPTPAAEAAASGRSRVTVEVVVSGDAPSDLFEQTVTLTTTSERFHQIALAVHAYPRGAVSLSPPRLHFAGLPKESRDAIEQTVTLCRRQPFHVTRAVPDQPVLRTEITTENAGELWQVRVIYTGGWQAGTHTGTIRIETDDPVRPTIDLPYVAEVP